MVRGTLMRVSVVTAGLVLLGAAPPAPASTLDRTSARAWIREATIAVRLGLSRQSAERAAMGRFIAAVEEHCPQSLPVNLFESGQPAVAELMFEARAELAF